MRRLQPASAVTPWRRWAAFLPSVGELAPSREMGVYKPPLASLTASLALIFSPAFTLAQTSCGISAIALGPLDGASPVSAGCLAALASCTLSPSLSDAFSSHLMTSSTRSASCSRSMVRALDFVCSTVAASAVALSAANTSGDSGFKDSVGGFYARSGLRIRSFLPSALDLDRALGGGFSVFNGLDRNLLRDRIAFQKDRPIPHRLNKGTRDKTGPRDLAVIVDDVKLIEMVEKEADLVALVAVGQPDAVLGVGAGGEPYRINSRPLPDLAGDLLLPSWRCASWRWKPFAIQ